MWRVGRHLDLYYDSQTLLNATIILNTVMEDNNALVESKRPTAPIQLGDEKVSLAMSPSGSIVSLTDNETKCKVVSHSIT